MVITQYHELANLFIRTMTFEKAGDVECDGGHVHTYDHAHFLSNGSVRITVSGVPTDYHAPAMIFIAANHVHHLEALVDNTIGHCIHALRSQDLSGEPLDPAMVPAGVSALLFAVPINKPA
jgi:quercetin dioxygenase-like cupin family protein